MKRPEPIEGYHGTEFEVDSAFKSSGPAVYLEWTTAEPDPATQGGFVEGFDRFTPDGARDLAKRLTDAADEIEGRS